MACVDAAHGPPYSTVALEARAEGNLPDPVAALDALLGFNACQHIPAKHVAHSTKALSNAATHKLASQPT